MRSRSRTIRWAWALSLAAMVSAPGPSPAQTTNPPGWRSESTAQSWSTLGTALPVVAAIATAVAVKEGDEIPVTLMLGTGIVIGPSLGYFYGDCPGRAVQGIGIRVGIGLLTAVAINQIVQEGSDDNLYGDLVGALAAGGMGAAMIVVHSTYDVARVRQTVHEQNLSRTKVELRVVPVVRGDGSIGCGLSLCFP